MKKVISLILIFIGCLCINVYADTSIKVGEEGTFKNNSCKITSCISNNSSVSVTFDENNCKYSGVSVGNSIISVVCEDNSKSQTINVNVVDSTVTTTTNNDPYGNITSAEVNCDSLGLLRKDLQGIFKVFKIVAPILVIVFSTYDFIKALAGKVEGEMKKAFTKFLKRLLFAVILFFLPSILDWFLGLIDNGYTTCINDI